jgi:hypothetical protein
MLEAAAFSRDSSTGAGGDFKFLGAEAMEDLEAFSGEAAPSLAPHCSQKLLEAGFLASHLGHTFVSGIQNSLVSGLARP